MIAGGIYRIPCNPRDTWRLWAVGDMHVGHRGAHKGLLNGTVQAIQNDPRAIWIGMGDYCMPLEAEILTIDGFKQYNTITLKDKVLCYHNGELLWGSLKGIYITPKSKFMHLHSKSFDIVCTPNHKWVVKDGHTDRSEVEKKVSAENLKSHLKILTAAESFEQGTLKVSTKEAALIGWLVTDGCLKVVNTNSINASISQTKEPYKTNIEDTFSDSITKGYAQSSGGMTFNLKTAVVRELLERMGTSPENLKVDLPSIVCKLPKSARKAMLEAMLQAEGWTERGHWRFSQKPGPVMDAFSILATLEGERLGMRKPRENGVQTVSLMGHRPYVGVADLNIKPLECESPAWCPSTEYGTWVVRYKDQISITGNCDFHDTKHKHFAAHDIDPTITVAEMGDFAKTMKHQVLPFFNPITDKCVGLLHGNHEYNYMRRNQVEGWHRELCEDLGVRNLGYSCVVKIVFVDQESGDEYPYTVYAVHGAGSANTPGGKKNRLIKYMNEIYMDADIYLMGHVHSADSHYDVKLSANRDATVIKERRRLGVITGTYLKTYHNDDLPSYGEMKGYAPTPIGSPSIAIVPKTGRVGVEWDFMRRE